MARTALTVQDITRSGVNPTANSADATNDHVINNNDGMIFLRITNGGGGASAWTANTPGSIDGMALPDKTLSVPAAGTRYFGPFPQEIYGSTLEIDLDVDTSVTVEVMRMKKG